MISLYQPPSGPCSNSERQFFWDKIVDEQNAGGANMKKFCNLHKPKISTYRGYKYRKQNTKINCCDITNSSNDCTDKFIQLQTAAKDPIHEHHKNEFDEASEIQVVFKNEHRLVLPLLTSGANLLLIIKAVAELRC